MALVVAYAPDAENYLERILRAVLRLPLEMQLTFTTAFLSRLAVEVPNMEICARSGWTMLDWIDLWLRWKPTAAENRFGEAEALSRLHRIPAIAESLKVAAMEADTFDKGNRLLLVPKANASLAPWLRQRLGAERLGGLYRWNEIERIYAPSRAVPIAKP
ncbi:MAG TPA: hypothetical protein VHB25_18250 [Gemmatimonadaceae bacterium]|nr:hypothetical protein [Gemmatimonadaceae bacterium]